MAAATQVGMQCSYRCSGTGSVRTIINVHQFALKKCLNTKYHIIKLTHSLDKLGLGYPLMS